MGRPPDTFFHGKKVLVTAGPTHEALDPVRFIGNQSTGKMGYAIAEAFATEGAQVTLVSGPTQLEPGNESIRVIRIVSAAEMYDACASIIAEMDIAVFSAAVADFTPARYSPYKIKSGLQPMTIDLEPTKDIAAELGKTKEADQVFVGFALETRDAITNAQRKLESKNLDLIVLNTLEEKGAGFGYDTNKVSMIDKLGNIDNFDLKQKAEVARDILDKIKKI